MRPGSTAVASKGRKQTYAECWERVSRLADGLRRLGARHQDRVALLSMSRLEYLEVYGACERAGYVMTTVNFRLSAAEMLEVLTDSAPHTLVIQDPYAEVVDGLRQKVGIRRYVCLGSVAPPAWAEPYEELAEAESPDGQPFRAAADDGAQIKYISSGGGGSVGSVGVRPLLLTPVQAVPSKLNQDHRHHIPLQKHRVTNWPAYEASLRQRGSLTVWFSEEAMAA